MDKKQVTFAIIMGFINAAFITFTLTAYNTGFSEGFFSRWSINYLIAFPIVFLSVIFLGSHVKKIFEQLINKN